MNHIFHILCINLDSRKDRWAECVEEFKKLNIENLVERYPAIQNKIGICGCTMSHVNCIKIAKERNYKNILILEDDVVFNNNIFFEVLYNAFDQLKSKNLQYDLIYLSSNLRGDDNKLIDKNLAKKINWDDKYMWTHENPDRMNIDVWYTNIQKMGNTYGTYPAIADQRSGYSDIIKQNSDYRLSNKYNKILEKTLNLQK